MKYRRRALVEAVQFNGRKEGVVHWGYVPDWLKLATLRPQGARSGGITVVSDCLLCVSSLGNVSYADPGDYVVRDEGGNLSVEKPERFAAKYEAVAPI